MSIGLDKSGKKRKPTSNIPVPSPITSESEVKRRERLERLEKRQQLRNKSENKEIEERELNVVRLQLDFINMAQSEEAAVTGVTSDGYVLNLPEFAKDQDPIKLENLTNYHDCVGTLEKNKLLVKQLIVGGGGFGREIKKAIMDLKAEIKINPGVQPFILLKNLNIKLKVINEVLPNEFTYKRLIAVAHRVNKSEKMGYQSSLIASAMFKGLPKEFTEELELVGAGFEFNSSKIKTKAIVFYFAAVLDYCSYFNTCKKRGSVPKQIRAFMVSEEEKPVLAGCFRQGRLDAGKYEVSQEQMATYLQTCVSFNKAKNIVKRVQLGCEV